ncbi:hypothetical protein [Streptomyces sp. NPDC055299]
MDEQMRAIHEPVSTAEPPPTTGPTRSLRKLAPFPPDAEDTHFAERPPL